MREIKYKSVLNFLKYLPKIWWEDLKELFLGLKKFLISSLKVSSLYIYALFFLIIAVALQQWVKTAITTFIIIYLLRKYDSGKDIYLRKK